MGGPGSGPRPGQGKGKKKKIRTRVVKRGARIVSMKRGKKTMSRQQRIAYYEKHGM